MKWFVLDRLFMAVQALLVVLIVCLVLRQFMPEWWQINRFRGDPTRAVIEMLLAKAQAEQLFRWWTAVLLSVCCGFITLLRAQLPWPTVDQWQVLVRAK